MVGTWEVTIIHDNVTQYAIFVFKSDNTIEWWIDSDPMNEPVSKGCLGWIGFHWEYDKDEGLELYGQGTLASATPCGFTTLVAWIQYNLVGEAMNDTFTISGTATNSRGLSFNVTITGRLLYI
ncbi:MAG: hypothetical protein JW737_03755 [Acidobacteria bacterium]|nr:hypothetical protein [Acidobacteriota bacterium]